MAQNQSVEQICSFAMTLLKRPPVLDINDTTSEEAVACNAVYPLLRDELLETYAWTFSVTRVELQQNATIPINQYDYAYTIPPDCLMPLELRANVPGGFPFRWVVEGGNILSNAAELFLKYVQRVIEPGKFTPMFALALSYRIASTLVYSSTGKEALAATLMAISDRYASRGESRDAQKGTQESFIHKDKWINDWNATYNFDIGKWPLLPGTQ